MTYGFLHHPSLHHRHRLHRPDHLSVLVDYSNLAANVFEYYEFVLNHNEYIFILLLEIKSTL